MKKLTVLAFLFCFGVAWGQQTPARPQGSELSQEGPLPMRLCPSCTEQRSVPPAKSEQRTAIAQFQTEPLKLAPLADIPHPEWYAMSFLPLVKGNESVAFVVSPAGKLGTIPMNEIAQAYKTGYRPFTAADLLAIANTVADEEKNLQRKNKELSEDYEALAARYNRLAEINSTPSVQPQPAVDERQAMRAMVFQSLLQRSFTAAPVRIEVQTVDCNKFPALCVNH
jgi:hypothetical protein